MSAFPWRIVGSRGWETTPTTVFCVGFKREPADFEGRFACFRTCLRAEGAERRPLWKRLKARLGYHLLSKRAFRSEVAAHLINARVVRGA